jgi:hypothetical protein
MHGRRASGLVGTPVRCVSAGCAAERKGRPEEKTTNRHGSTGDISDEPGMAASAIAAGLTSYPQNPAIGAFLQQVPLLGAFQCGGPG